VSPLDRVRIALSERHIYGLRAVERMSGLPATTILEWEERHGVGKPVPGASGEMLYSRDDVEELLAFRRGDWVDGGPSADAVAAGAPVTEDPPAKANDTSAQLLVLLAERDPYAADLTEYFLRTEGYNVATVFSVEDARQHLEQAEPDLAIVELLLDGGSGFSLVEQISAGGKCPVIVLSALDPRDHPAVRDAAVVLPKPVRELELVSAVRDLLGTSALVRSTHSNDEAPVSKRSDE
jgi:CheY-like chemotaxis protein